jgi:hypothetical protein
VFDENKLSGILSTACIAFFMGNIGTDWLCILDIFFNGK